MNHLFAASVLFPATALATALLVAAPAAAQLNSDAPIDIVADVSEYTNSQCKQTFRGAAEALQADSRLRADVIRAFFQTRSTPRPGAVGGNCGDLIRVEAEGSVFYVTPAQRVRGDAAVYDIAADTIEMTGDVVAVQGESVMTGARMTIDLKTGEGRVVGVARGLNQAGRPRGVFYPNKTKPGAAK